MRKCAVQGVSLFRTFFYLAAYNISAHIDVSNGLLRFLLYYFNYAVFSTYSLVNKEDKV